MPLKQTFSYPTRVREVDPFVSIFPQRGSNELPRSTDFEFALAIEFELIPSRIGEQVYELADRRVRFIFTGGIRQMLYRPKRIARIFRAQSLH